MTKVTDFDIRRLATPSLSLAPPSSSSEGTLSEHRCQLKSPSVRNNVKHIQHMYSSGLTV